MVNAFVAQGLARGQASLRQEERQVRELDLRERGVGVQERQVGVQEELAGLQAEKFTQTSEQSLRKTKTTAFDKLVNSLAVLEQIGKAGQASEEIIMIRKALTAKASALGKELKISQAEFRAEVLSAQIKAQELIQLSQGESLVGVTPGGEPQTLIEGAPRQQDIVTAQLPDGTFAQFPENAVPPGSTIVSLQAGKTISPEGQVVDISPEGPTSIGNVVAPILAKIAAGQEISKGERKVLAEVKASGLLTQFAAGQGLSVPELLGGPQPEEGEQLNPNEQAIVTSLKASGITEEKFKEEMKTSKLPKESLARIAKALGFTINGN